MPKRTKQALKPKNPLDTVSGKRGRGRPGVRASEIVGRATNYRWILEQLWKRLAGPLLKAQTEEEIIRAFRENASPYEQEFVPVLAPLILRVLNEPKFPKREPKPRKRKPKLNPRIVFLADSLAGRGWVSPRRSRDICERERKKKVHQIIREEYFIECTCGYKGPAFHGKCPKCRPNEIFIPFTRFQL
jgi:hypothetical protein